MIAIEKEPRIDPWDSLREYPTLADVVRGEWRSVNEMISYLFRSGRWMGMAVIQAAERRLRELRPGISDSDLIGILREEIRD